MALTGIKVIELSGLAPAPFAGMILSDFGAKVIRVDRVQQMMTVDRLARGKLSVALNLKKPAGVEVLHKMCKTADVLIEPYRPGVMEKMGLGPQILMKSNPGLIYARMTGFGQAGAFKRMAGHDINYLALTGILSLLGRKGENPIAPINLLCDFAGGGLMCSLGIVMALLEKTRSGKGQIIDANMVEGAAYLGSWMWTSRDLGFSNRERGENLLDTGAPFYETYKTADNRYMAVGAIEPQFYSQLLKGLDIDEDELPDQQSQDDWPVMKRHFARIFAKKTQDEWCQIFDGTDACVTPVLSLDEAPQHPHNRERQSFLTNTKGEREPAPAPVLSRTPAKVRKMCQPVIGLDTATVLHEIGYSAEDIKVFERDNVIELAQLKSQL
ncbi:alpha-methylacyl-CoA racemase-like [Anneissia japonica]|uniref:alpha-methylacyl-CoA racemase-like n=1 Tax=Anneissia japonica TaxID=1529436 RepID=UPI001425761E|nr:alpha-methylacyl-CoA racemase-like [Anneissia japonica]XP_033120730.1 alpha-methylacyl-CoA racemase-like [Anneissia japonica]XP_033120731.1 alpha-methylacyl-CoA racemase-like [Anneissia japonica]